jgi:O-acetyl-ADP-ribose deacetylase (regulator of RNase III)
MKFEYHKGDLLASDEAVLAHGCNTHGVMGAGIAAQFSVRYPQMQAEYSKLCSQKHFVPGSAMRWDELGIGLVPQRIIFNLATQDRPGPHARCEWVYLSFRNMAEQMMALRLDRVAIPKIGCGIGGLDWDRRGFEDVRTSIELAMSDTEKTHRQPGFFTVAVYEL